MVKVWLEVVYKYKAKQTKKELLSEKRIQNHLNKALRAES